MSIKISTSGLRLDLEQRLLMESICNTLCDRVVGEIYLWKGFTGITEAYTYPPQCKSKGTMLDTHRRFYKFKSKDEMIGFFKALRHLDQETLQTKFL